MVNLIRIIVDKYLTETYILNNTSNNILVMIIHDTQTLLLIIVGVILLTVTDPVGDICEQVTYVNQIMDISC